MHPLSPTQLRFWSPSGLKLQGTIVVAQSDALEDWYGRLARDGSFPHVSGKG